MRHDINQIYKSKYKSGTLNNILQIKVGPTYNKLKERTQYNKLT